VSDCEEETKEDAKAQEKFIEVDDMVARPEPSEEYCQAFAKRRISGYFQRVDQQEKVKKVALAKRE